MHSIVHNTPLPEDFKAVGVSFRPGYPKNLYDLYDKAAAGFTGQEVEPARYMAVLEREPDNQYDKNAVKIMIDGQHVAYIPADRAIYAAAKLDGGVAYSAYATILCNNNKDGSRTKKPGIGLCIDWYT